MEGGGFVFLHGCKIVSLTSIFSLSSFFLKVIFCGGAILVIESDLESISEIMKLARNFSEKDSELEKKLNFFFSRNNLVNPNVIGGIEACTLII